MVRVLSCYHFRGQKIGRCDEAAAVTVAGQSVVIGIEDNINVYITGHEFQPSEVGTAPIGETGMHCIISEVGAPITFCQKDRSPISPIDDKRLANSCEQRGSASCSSSVSSIESDTEVKLSHTFQTVDLVRSISYNQKGNYLLCLECRDAEGGESRSSSIRVYFQWDKRCEQLPMRTRIAGVSPSVNDLEKPVLTMVEIPLTSPATAVASCSLTGHLACLSEESTINIFSYRIKEVSGRSKLPYPDFDRLCTVEVSGFAPESLSFLGNFVSCAGNGKVHVFRLRKVDKSWSPSMATERLDLTKGRSRDKMTPESRTSTKRNTSTHKFDCSNKVTFDPNDESVTVHLPSITRANRRRAVNTVLHEEFLGEINLNKSKIVFPAVSSLILEDVLRLSLPQPGPGCGAGSHERFLDTGIYPIRINDQLGGVACVVGLSKEAMLYHLPTKDACSPIRVANYTFTAPLVSFTFDSLFFHALTESGLETYTSRSLYYCLQNCEGFERYENACPLKNERPCLVGIRPFVRVRFMAANEALICLLACPTPIGTSGTTPPTLSPSQSNLAQDERLWTIYSLELPDMDMLYEDTMRVAKTQENQPDTHFTLLCELHLILRTCINAVPDDSAYYIPRYQKLCKIIGLECLKASCALASDAKECSGFGIVPQVGVNQNAFGVSQSSEELLELGVTYLKMAKMDLQDIFSLENAALVSDQQYISGTVKLIEVLLSCYCAKNLDKHNFSPALSSSIVDFLSRNSPNTLVDLVIKVPFLRENNSTRLVEILHEIVSSNGYTGKETVALILTLIAAGGVESNVRSQIQKIFQKVKTKDVAEFLQLEFILDRHVKHSALTDVAICLTAVHSELPTSILSDAMKNQEISVSEVMLAFAKAVNLNSESQIQRSLAKALRLILESYFADKISETNKLQKTGPSVTSILNPSFTEDERHAVQALVRSYISDISISPTHLMSRSSTTNSNLTSESNVLSETTDKSETENTDKSKVPNNPAIDVDSPTECNVDMISKNQVFGKIPSFINLLLDVDSPGGSITPTSMTFSSTMFNNQESMESYIRLLSLLSSPCGKVEGVKDSVLTFVYNNSASVKSSPLHLILQMFCEPVDTAVSILISRQPTTVILYAKEMFGKCTSKWKTLVTQLKKRINLNPNTVDADMFSTIIESVYLHLANTLSLTELEEVLEKGADDVAKFRSTCKRVELANSYASMVIQISTDYLQNKQ